MYNFVLFALFTSVVHVRTGIMYSRGMKVFYTYKLYIYARHLFDRWKKLPYSLLVMSKFPTIKLSRKGRRKKKLFKNIKNPSFSRHPKYKNLLFWEIILFWNIIIIFLCFNVILKNSFNGQVRKNRCTLLHTYVNTLSVVYIYFIGVLFWQRICYS